MKRTAINPGAPIKGSGFLGLRRKIAGKIKSRGMAGRTPNVVEQRFISAIVSLGCLACLKDGHENPWVSPHHILGRTAPDAHLYVIGLCKTHHQHDDTDPAGRIGVHPYKARFEAKYGTQLELLAEAKVKLGLD